jgi:pyruvate kinase
MVLARSDVLFSSADLLAQLDGIDAEVHCEAENTLRWWGEAITDPSFLPAASNLAHYLALRQRDLNAIQSALVAFGLSSLGRSESHVAATLQAVRASLARIAGVPGPAYPAADAWTEGQQIMALHKRKLFGAAGLAPAVMVTMPTEAAVDRGLVDRLVNAGMNCARINCAHDGPDVWKAIIGHVRRAATTLGRDCRILMDLGGPKCRIETVSPPKPERLHVGDRFRLLREPEAAPVDPLPAITISFPEILARLVPGSVVWINDGKIRSRVVEALEGGWTLEVVGAKAKGEKLHPAKGVNMPDVDLGLAPLSADDLRDLDFVAQHADLVGFSFVQRPADILLLDQHLTDRLPGKPLPPLVLKIETAEAVRNLPRLIVQAAGRRSVAVMIARGDLAVALGFGRLAEIQEEMLWLCEAACVPVVWATQVLDDLVREGLPSRAEATDAAMAQRAECVMLNKGPYLVDAMRFLADVFVRMHRHQTKKAARFGPLHSWPLAGLKLTS